MRLHRLEARVDLPSHENAEHRQQGHGNGGDQREARRRWIMKASAKPPPAMVLVRYMIAGPTAMRTALRSFVNRAMRSPVRIRE